MSLEEHRSGIEAGYVVETRMLSATRSPHRPNERPVGNNAENT